MIDDAGPPPLAQYTWITDYQPQYGDYVIWTGWFSVWHGFVVGYDKNNSIVDIIFAAMPLALIELQDESEQKENTYQIDLLKIKRSKGGEWAVMRHEQAQNSIVWYI